MVIVSALLYGGESSRAISLVAVFLFGTGVVALLNPRHAICLLASGLALALVPDLGLLVLMHMADTGGAGELGVAIVAILLLCVAAPFAAVAAWITTGRFLRGRLPEPRKKTRYAIGLAIMLLAVAIAFS